MTYNSKKTNQNERQRVRSDARSARPGYRLRKPGLVNVITGLETSAELLNGKQGLADELVGGSRIDAVGKNL